MISVNFKDYNIEIKDSVLEIMSKYIQIKSKDESGGMLIGSILTDEKTIMINDCTEPIKDDKAGKYEFYRSNKHNKLLERKWIESNYTKMYIGEWHTHPQYTPIPSCIDKRSWEKLMKDSITDSPIVVFIIRGINTMDIWIGDRRYNKLERWGNYEF